MFRHVGFFRLRAISEPDVTKIDAEVRAIEKHRGDQRLTFIRSVGEAAEVLTDEQRSKAQMRLRQNRHSRWCR